MITAKCIGGHETSAYGLTQWDYGQDLMVVSDIAIPDGTEVDFCQNDQSGIAYARHDRARIPDWMLQNATDITAYLYVRDPTRGETVLTVYLPIMPRKRPKNYVLPDMEEYLRLLPPGGDPGQVPVKQGGEYYAVGWGYRADGIECDGEYLQLVSGDIPVGERVRIVQGEREIELSNDGENIKWRYTDSNDWQVLASLESLKGPPGPPGPPGVTPEFEVREGHLIAKYE